MEYSVGETMNESEITDQWNKHNKKYKADCDKITKM